MKKSVASVLAVLFLSLSIPTAAIAQDVKVGVMASRGALKAMQKWSEFGKYLQAQTGSSVKIVPVGPAAAPDAMASGEIDYLLANPAVTVIVQQKNGAKPIATMNGKHGPQFAGVIIAKKGKGISKAADLKGKKVMAFKFKKSAAAYIFQVKHLMDQGVNPHKDFAVFKEAKKQDDIVLAVKAGAFDAGFIKSGLLEAMAKEGKIKLDDFVIVDKQTDSYALLHSTQLYPSWTFSAASTQAADKVAAMQKSLFALKAGDGAAKKAKIKGFVEPLALTELENTLRALKLPPFDG